MLTLTVRNCGGIDSSQLERLAKVLLLPTSDVNAAPAALPLLSQLTFDFLNSYRRAAYDPTSLVLRIAEYRAEISAGENSYLGTSVLKDMQVGRMGFSRIPNEFAERSQRLAQRGCRITPSLFSFVCLSSSVACCDDLLTPCSTSVYVKKLGL